MIKHTLCLGAALAVAVGCGGTREPAPQQDNLVLATTDGGSVRLTDVECSLKANRIDLSRKCREPDTSLPGACWGSKCDSSSAALGPGCLVGPTGDIFVTLLATSTIVVGDGWTFRGSGGDSDLSDADLARCWQAFEVVGWSPVFNFEMGGRVCD
jgi:hypothetical protein